MLRRRLAYSLAFLLFSLGLFSQEKADSLVRLLGCDLLQQVDEGGYSYRKALGNARFYHNSTLLVCDTAIWNVNTNVIRAIGNVRIIQDETVLNSDKLDYFIDESLAQFRGTLVQLQDKEKNTLRTRNLDYNTKDSVATFRNGASMRDKDGQIIESKYGTYDSKISTFTFTGTVNMYTDSIFVKSEKIEYNTDANFATFDLGTMAWKDDNMLCSKSGWYDRNKEIFLFRQSVHLMDPTREIWADTLKFYRATNDIEMFGNVELLDSERNLSAFAGYMQYLDSVSTMTMSRNPAMIAVVDDNGQKDTVYVSADSLRYRAVRMCDLPQSELDASNKRLDEINADAVTAYRRKAAEEARAAAESAKKQKEQDDPNSRFASDKGRGVASGGQKLNLPAPDEDFEGPVFYEYVFIQKPDSTMKRGSRNRNIPDSTSMRGSRFKNMPDSTAIPGTPGRNMPDGAGFADGLNPLDSLPAAADSLSTAADSLASVPPDTTKMGFLLALRNVKAFRKDMQVSCDSLAYSDLDSLIRLYDSPMVWQEVTRQYSADSISVMIKDNTLKKASLMSNAFIVIQEDSLCYDQIKGTEMMAYFDSTGVLSRFDSMGGASGLFYIEENDVLATVNKFESKMLTATLTEGNINDLYYFEDVKTDAYPIVQLPREERKLKGFLWCPEKRPAEPSDVTASTPRESERSRYESLSRPKFIYTDDYFPGYMAGVHKMLASRDSVKAAQAQERKLLRLQQQAVLDSLNALQESMTADLDSLKAATDSLAGVRETAAVLKDSAAFAGTGVEKIDSVLSSDLKVGEPAVKRHPVEAAVDSTAFVPEAPPELSAKEKADSAKAAKKALAEQNRLARKEAREAKWAELDARDAAKKAVKDEKALERKRKSTAKAVIARNKRDAREQKILEKYIERYTRKEERRKEKELNRQNKKKPSANDNLQWKEEQE
ncbi:MAG: OstA-like protein [Candidatus Cryptobacteroides sp.]